MAPPAPWLPKDIHGKPTVDTELHCLLGSQARREFTAEALRAPSKEFLVKKYSGLCELRVSAVKYCAFQLAADRLPK